MRSRMMRLYYRKKLRFTRGRISKMSQERQKLSFFLVVIFLGVFALIVLAEVLFVDGVGGGDDGDGGGNGGRYPAAFYEEEEEGEWETPRPLEAPAASDGGDGGGGAGRLADGLRWMLGGKWKSQGDKGEGEETQRHQRFQKSLARHQGEMESLIRNMSKAATAATAATTATEAAQSTRSTVVKTKATLPPPPHNYSEDFLPPSSFDFSLRRHSGLDARWQPVNGTRGKFYVYSAFYDARGAKKVVRVIGATRTKHPEKVWCRLYNKDDDDEQVQEEEEEEDDGFYEEGASISVKAARVLASVSVIRENWNLRYSAVFVICPLPPGLEEIPDSVSVIADDGDGGSGGGRGGGGPHAAPTNQLAILNRDADPAALEAQLSASDEVSACVKPLHFDYGRTLELLEFLELNKLLGVTRFTLYNHTVSREVSCVLRDYADRGEVDLLPWSLNMASQSEIRTEGLFAALNDCLYRNMWRYNYLLLIDLDEFVVPRNNRTLAQMIRFLDSQKARILSKTRGVLRSRAVGSFASAAAATGRDPRVVSSYSFQNAFFYLQFPDDQEAFAFQPKVAATVAAATATVGTTRSPPSPSPPPPPPPQPQPQPQPPPPPQPQPPPRMPLRTLTKTKRKTKFNPQKQRSKYICVPRRVREAGNHFIWEFSEGFHLNVPVSVGFLHHYRVCEFGGDDCVRTDSKVDRTAYRYKEDLLGNVAAVLERLRDKCGLGHILEQHGVYAKEETEKAEEEDSATQGRTTDQENKS